MSVLLDKDNNKSDNQFLGGKGTHLFALKKAGLEVPKFLVIPADYLQNLIPNEIHDADNLELIRNYIDAYQLDEELLNKCFNYFEKDSLLAVRSSAMVEDGKKHSFAGQFESFLYVRPEDLRSYIKKVWLSNFSDRVTQYKSIQGVDNSDQGIAIIVQEMIDAEVSGVAFGMNPANGNTDEIIINAVYGLGEGLVSGQLNADYFCVKDGAIQSEIVEKDRYFTLNQKDGYGVIEKEVNESLQNKASLSEKNIHEISVALKQMEQMLGGPQDMEFAIKEQLIYFLQTRPITRSTLREEEKSNYILWDNSNIIESYPGVTTPLTFSFISQSYQKAYQLFSAYMGVNSRVIHANEQVFKNTLGLINGRVYYNLKTWYHMLAMLPGYSINARFMENMMGVKERFDIPEDYKLSRSKAWISILKMALSMINRMFALPRKRREFMLLLEETISSYKNINYDKQDAPQLLQLYLNFEHKLLNEWKAPLLNDFFAMIWFGMLQKYSEKYLKSDNKNIQNDLLCGSRDIISTEPIHRSIAISSFVHEHNELLHIFKNQSPEDIWETLKNTKSSAVANLKTKIDHYIKDFGERCVGELKLETISYEQDPVRLVKMLKSYVNQNITLDSTSSSVEMNLRREAEKELKQKLKYKPLKKWWLNFVLKQTRILVSGRENLRYERTRAFGIVRKIFSELGNRFYEKSVIQSPRDIFYLTKEEITAYLEGRSVSTDLQNLSLLRKAEFQQFETMEVPAERFATYGMVYAGNDFFNISNNTKSAGDLKGVGCCPGKVKAKVRHVINPNEVDSMEGDILITSSTDPGWVTLFPSASGIIVERGSLLSHSAIVSREMGIPCIVGVTGLLKTLKTGDLVKMDGSAGTIERITKER